MYFLYMDIQGDRSVSMAERKKVSKRIWSHMDYLLIALVCIASLMGIAAIFSATYSMSGTMRYVLVQSAAFVMGIIAMLLISMLDYELLGDASKYIYIGNVLLLIMVLIIGIGTSIGTKGWIDLGIVSFQPAEIVKIGFILTFAKHLEKVKQDINYIPTLLALLAHAGVLIALILLQPDAGTAMVFIFITLSMIFVAGISYKYVAATFAAAVVGLPIAWYFKDRFLSPYQIDRILVFFDPYRDPLHSGYNVIQSEIAVGSGQLFGKGYLQGSQNQFEYLPAKHTDFIFATIGEEWGFVGAVVVVALLIAIICRCIYVGQNARSDYGTFICIGVAAMLAFHTFENIGMCIQLMPVTGIPLPFFSYGGSSLLTNLVAIGFVNSVRIRRKGISF